MPGIATKVHIVLDRAIAKDPEKCRLALTAVRNLSGIHDINESRLERFGIISGIVDSSKINALRRMEQVRSVSVDEERHAF